MKTYHLKGHLNFEEYLEAHKHLARKRRLWLRLILGIYALGAIIYGGWLSSERPDSFFLAIGGVFLL